MAINKYTFFSPNGNDFPVTANADGKLYMMLTGLNYNDLRLKHWSAPLNTALNRVYVNTSLVIGGRYFELRDHSIQLRPAVTNYIHAVIDLSNTTEPITITVQQSNTTNSVDINNASGVLKVCFETITTSGNGITNVTPTAQTSVLDNISANNISLKSSIDFPAEMSTVHSAPGLQLQLTKKNDDLVIVRFLGSIANIKKGQTMARTLVDKPFRPAVVQSLIGHLVGKNAIFHVDLNPDGTITWWGGDVGSDSISARGNASYFIK